MHKLSSSEDLEDRDKREWRVVSECSLHFVACRFSSADNQELPPHSFHRWGTAGVTKLK